MTTIEAMEKKVEQIGNRKWYVEKFISALGDPTAWEFTGTVIDSGRPSARCVCGHPIRYQFVIQDKRDTSKTAIVGSECINHFADIAPALFETLSAVVLSLKEVIASGKQAAKKAQAEAEVNALKVEYEAVCKEAIALYDRYSRQCGRVPHRLYYVRWSITTPPQYKQKAAYKRWYSSKIKLVREAMAAVQQVA